VWIAPTGIPHRVLVSDGKSAVQDPAGRSTVVSIHRPPAAIWPLSGHLIPAEAMQLANIAMTIHRYLW
jgi:hypothetical protein